MLQSETKMKVGKSRAIQIRRAVGGLLTAVTVWCALSVAMTPVANAQEAPIPQVPPVRTTSENHYLIGVGDVLDIRVFGRPQLTRDAVRVDVRGKIRMPLLEDELQASCRTEVELATDITARYLKFVRRPQVDVFIREYNSQPVAVIGAVSKAGRFQLQRPVRLLELLTFAGGPTERAGRALQVVRADTLPVCEAGALVSPEGTGLVAYRIADVLAGQEESNPYARPGDIISIPEAEQVFVVGRVVRPSSLQLREQLTVSQAIAMAGGLSEYAKTDRIRVIRQLPGSKTKTEMVVDIKAIEKRRAPDLVLQANDIVDVPVSGGKKLLGSLMGTITQLPVSVIR